MLRMLSFRREFAGLGNSGDRIVHCNVVEGRIVNCNVAEGRIVNRNVANEQCCRRFPARARHPPSPPLVGVPLNQDQSLMFRTCRRVWSRHRSWRVLVGCMGAAVTTGCITSGPGEYGVSAEVRDLELTLCPDGMIDDAEDNDTQINVVGERNGYWFTFKDEVGSTVDPDGEFHMSEGGPEGSKFAARMKGTMAAGAQNVYPYVGMGFNFSNPKAPFDTGPAQGIQFWAKGPGRVRFKTPDVMTDPTGDLCTNCYNDFGVDIFLSETWQRYTVPFEKLEQQPGWGDRAPRVAKDKLFAVQWQFGTASKEYDVAVDNVALVGCDQ